ncbi:hypothetical protein [Microbulbifer hainanensis]|uniref:hypothetical protein n=1 Tax=Microbulbifer hainanensis TaxID=2735675 RepID=UPI0018681101|nr:hypothetical protein [Microbulbifer hainanensis]
MSLKNLLASALLVALSYPAVSGQLLNPADMDELTSELASDPDAKRTFQLEFKQSVTASEISALLKQYDLKALRVSGTYQYDGREHTIGISDLVSYQGSFVEQTAYQLHRINLIDRRSSRKRHHRGLLFDPTLNPERASNGNTEIKWHKLVVMGSYTSINRLVGDPTPISLIFTHENKAPLYEAVKGRPIPDYRAL